jgi:PAS domain S-box-containing protein
MREEAAPRSRAAEQRGRELAELALDRLSRLHAVRSALAGTLTPRQIASIVLNAAVNALKANGGAVRLVDPSVLLAGIGDDLDDIERVEEARVEPGRAAVPLMVEGRRVGVLAVRLDDGRQLDNDERDLLIAFANQCAQALERARLFELALSTQEDLRRSRDQLAAILSGIAEGVTVQDKQGRLVYANDIAAHLSGFASAADLLNAPMSEIFARYALFDESDQPLPFDSLPARRLLRGEPASEIMVHYRDGTTGQSRWSILNATAVTDDQGRVQLVVNIFRDITERKRQTDAAAFLARASNVLSSSLDVDISLGHIAQLAVPSLADWCIIDLVATDGQVQRLVVAHADPLRREQAEALRRQDPIELASGAVGRVLRSARSELVEAEGSWIVAAMRARRNTLGVISLGVIESARRYARSDLELVEDLAARAALTLDNAQLFQEAQEQAAHQAELNAALRATIDERDRAVADLQVALRTRDEFLASASHDLKNPLASIKATAQLLQRRVERGEAGDLAAELEPIREGLRRVDVIATRAAGQVDELTELARMEVGRPLDLERRPADLVGLVAEVRREQQVLHDRHTLLLISGDERLVAEVDAGRLSRVLANLVDNAVKYSPDGGEVILRVQSGDDGWAIIDVEDHGIGIPAADRDRVFERFQRASNVQGRIGGTGIGLASARHIVESHGGTIEVESREGEGSLFRIRVPLSPPNPSNV